VIKEAFSFEASEATPNLIQTSVLVSGKYMQMMPREWEKHAADNRFSYVYVNPKEQGYLVRQPLDD
jgi:hypothetical protein